MDQHSTSEFRLKLRQSRWLHALLYGLGGSVLIAIIFFALAGVAALPKPQLQVTPANVEGHIRDWLDAFGLGVQKQNNPASEFMFLVTLHNNNTVVVSKPKQRDHYLQLQGTVSVSTEHAAIISKLSAGQSMRMYDEVTLEMARSKVGFSVVAPPDGRIRAVTVSRGLLIDGLTGDILANRLDEMDSGMVLAKEAVRLALSNTHAIGTTLLQ